MAPQRGLTLLEMLISLVILSSVMAIASTAYSYYVTGFNERGQSFNRHLSSLKQHIVWQDQLASAFYYYVETLPNKYVPVFTGTEKEISWMSTNSVNEPGMATRSWLGIKQGQLNYCEQRIQEKLVTELAYDKDELCSAFSVSLQAASALKISYYAWPNVIDRHFYLASDDAYQANKRPVWSSAHNSAVRELLPEWVKLKLYNEYDEEHVIWVRLENNDISRLQAFSRGNSA